MNKASIFLLVCSVAGFSAAACAESLVKFPASPAAWTVEIVPMKGGSPAVPETPVGDDMKKIDVTKVDGVSRFLITWANGKTTERWTFGQQTLAIATDTHDGSPSFLSNEDVALGGEFAVAFDAAAFKWLSEGQLKGSVTFKDRQCRHYEGTVVVSHQINTAGEVKTVQVTLHCQAWIDEKTLLPVAFFDGVRLGVFTFLPPPAGPLKAPPAIQKAIEQYVAASRPLK